MSWDIFPKSKIQYFLEKLKTKLDLKVDKEIGKGLSTNDFDNTYKVKVDKIDTSTSSASGNPISISGLKSDQLAVNPIIIFEPIQSGSGTPSPSNIRAISGYDKVDVLSCGKNLAVDLLSVSGSGGAPTITKNGNQYTFSGTTSGGVFITIPIKANKTYVLSYTLVSGSFVNVRAYTDFASTMNLGTITPGTAFTFTQDGYVRFWIGSSVTISNLQLEYGDSATTYVNPIIATKLTESLGQTVYWGEWDVRSGKFKVIGKIIDLGDLTWIYNSTYDKFYAQTVTDALKAEGKTCVCSRYLAVDNISSIAGTMPDKSINMMSDASNPNSRIFIYDTDYDDGSVLKTSLEGTQFVYKLATPFTIQLTPRELTLLKTYAYLLTNGSNIQLSYHLGELASLADVTQVAESMENGFAFFDTKIAKKRTLGISGNVPTAEELSAIDYESGSQIIDFYNAGYSATEIHASLIFTRSAVGYGVGILLSYYSNGVISFVRQSNGAVAIYPITHS